MLEEVCAYQENNLPLPKYLQAAVDRNNKIKAQKAESA